MRDEKEGGKKQARSNKQQDKATHTPKVIYMYMYVILHVRCTCTFNYICNIFLVNCIYIHVEMYLQHSTVLVPHVHWR